jgi:hypothetical protein
MVLPHRRLLRQVWGAGYSLPNRPAASFVAHLVLRAPWAFCLRRTHRW